MASPFLTTCTYILHTFLELGTPPPASTKKARVDGQKAAIAAAVAAGASPSSSSSTDSCWVRLFPCHHLAGVSLWPIGTPWVLPMQPPTGPYVSSLEHRAHISAYDGFVIARSPWILSCVLECYRHLEFFVGGARSPRDCCHSKAPWQNVLRKLILEKTNIVGRG